MIINNNVQAVEFGNVEQGGEFKIRNSAKAFSILSSGLYSNKIRAIIRELSCNAIDGHVAKGNPDRNFEVHLPTRMEPHFSVRDFGIGLSHDDILNVYTTYFESTKTGSNELIGGLGLGCKSPFSYTDNFTVTSIKDGEKNLYTAYINENGLPSITRMTSTETDEESGVEVSFPVKEDDFYRFNKEAQIVFSVFKQHPIVTGNYSRIEFNIKHANVIDGVDLYDSNSVHSGAVALMGNVAYPIQVPNSDVNLGDYASLLRNNLFIRFDIGSLDVQASREGLSYIPSTIKAIKDKLVEIGAALTALVKTKIEAETNMWERKHLLDEMRNITLFSLATQEYIKSNDVPFTNKVNGTTMSRIQLDVADIGKRFNVKFMGYGKNYRNKVSKSESRNAHNTDGTSTEVWDITIDRITTFTKADDNIKNIRGRSMQYLREDRNSRTEIHIMMPLDETKPAKYDELLKELHNPKFVAADKLPVPPKKERSKSAQGSILVSEKTGYYNDSKHRWCEFDFDDEHDEDAIYYYVPLTNKQVASKHFGELSLSDYMSNFINTGMKSLKNIEIYGVRKSALEEIEKLDNWVNFEDEVANLVQKELTDEDFYVKLAVHRENYITQFTSGIISLVDDKSPLKQVWKKIKSVDIDRTVHVDTYRVRKLASKFAPTVDVSSKVDKVVTMCDNMRNRYPLIERVYGFEEKHVAEYINLIDTHRGV